MPLCASPGGLCVRNPPTCIFFNTAINKTKQFYWHIPYYRGIFAPQKEDFMSTDSHPGIVQSMLTNKCPHCRKGSLFINPNPYDLKNTMKMPDHCPVCGQKFDLQTGFYFGTGYVSYGLTIMITLASLAIWWPTVGFGLHDNRIWGWLGINAVLLIVLQPVLQRLSRSIWIALFVRYDPAA